MKLIKNKKAGLKSIGISGIIITGLFVIILLNLINATDLADSGGAFFEDFESGFLTANNWTVSGAGVNWAIDTLDSYTGTYHIHVENTDGESTIRTNISTEAYKNISFSFYAKTNGLDAWEYVASDWYNGTSWIQVLNIEDIAAYTLYNFSLSPDANNNTKFAIRFRCSSNRNNEVCFVDNVQVHGTEMCITNLVNTLWSDWSNLTCSGDEMNQSRSRVQYDNNSCGEIANQTFDEYQLAGPTLQNTTWTDWINISCLPSDTMNQSRNLTQYDNYACASNQTFIEYRNTESCDYCTPSLVNTTWSDWGNVTVCRANNTILQERNRIQYDSNSCGEIANQAYSENQEANCTYIFNDCDGDGVADENDTCEGDESYIQTTGIADINVSIGGNRLNETNGTFSDKQKILICDGSKLIVDFDHNFSINEINLSKINITLSTTYIIVNLSGQLAGGEKKTLYIDDNSFIALCVKDAEISSISEISTDCNGNNETDFTTCLGNSTGVAIDNITCYDEGNKIKIENLSYSGIRGIQESTPSQSAAGSVGGSGSGGGGITRKNETVISGGALFDIITELIDSEIETGKELVAKISLINFGELRNFSINVSYQIQDSSGKVIIQEKEQKIIDARLEYIKRFSLPSNIELEKYVLKIELEHPGQIKPVISENTFNIIEKQKSRFIWIIISIIMVAILIIAVATYFFKIKKTKRKIATVLKLRKKHIMIKFKEKILRFWEEIKISVFLYFIKIKNRHINKEAMIIDNNFVKVVKKKIKGIDCRGKWIVIKI